MARLQKELTAMTQKWVERMAATLSQTKPHLWSPWFVQLPWFGPLGLFGCLGLVPLVCLVALVWSPWLFGCLDLICLVGPLGLLWLTWFYTSLQYKLLRTVHVLLCMSGDIIIYTCTCSCGSCETSFCPETHDLVI